MSPRLIGITEWRWYRPEDAPETTGHAVCEVGEARVDSIREFHELRAEESRAFLLWYERFGPLPHRTVCRRVLIAAD